MKALLELTRMRLLLLARQPEIVFWAFVFPVMLSMVLGLAFRSSSGGTSRVGVLDGDGARALVGRLEGHEELDVELFAARLDLERRLQSGALDVAIETSGGLELSFDPGRQASALGRLRVVEAVRSGAGEPEPEGLRSVARSGETGARYVDWFVPGLLALSVMSTSIWAVGFAFVEARQKRLLKRFLVTPMKKASFLLSFVLARVVLLVFEVALLLLFAHFVLRVPFHGSLPLYFAMALFGGLVFAGMGVLLGSRIRAPESAAGLINLTMMPMGLCSGVFFSYERFAEVLHPLIRALPLTAFVDAMRAMHMEGRGLASLGSELLVQLVWGVAAFWIGLAIFRWR